jgi:hypothetical protein
VGTHPGSFSGGEYCRWTSWAQTDSNALCASQHGKNGYLRSVFRTPSLPQGGPQVFGANLKCSESKRAGPLLCCYRGMGPRPTPHRRFWCYPGGRPRDGWEAASLEQNSQSGPIKAATFAGLEHCGDDAWDGERAADALHSAGISSKPFGNHAHTGPFRSRQGLTHSAASRGVFPHACPAQARR